MRSESVVQLFDSNNIFFRKYFLPCKHKFFSDLNFKEMSLLTYFTSDMWMEFTIRWEESGFELYYSRETVQAPTNSAELLSSAHFKKSLEILREFYFRK